MAIPSVMIEVASAAAAAMGTALVAMFMSRRQNRELAAYQKAKLRTERIIEQMLAAREGRPDDFQVVVDPITLKTRPLLEKAKPKPETPRSPQLFEWLLVRSGGDRGAVLGDLAETYHSDVQNYGREAAAKKRRKELFRSSIAFGVSWLKKIVLAMIIEYFRKRVG